MLSFILNFPYTFAGILSALICFPNSMRWHKNPPSLVFNVHNCWWGRLHMKNMHACTIGHVIILTDKTLKNDFEHEIIHVEQYIKYPFIFPFLYYWESYKKGYRMNRFEDEAYTVSKSIYKGKPQK